MPLTICTWNINSVRLREPLVMRLLEEEKPDVLCLQETKSPVDKVPLKNFADLGYEHAVIRGEKGYNGVMILARLPMEDAGQRDFCAKGDARHVAGRLADGTVIHNYYVPAGGDEPDREKNVKFDHKLNFLSEMTNWFTDEPPARSILVGDLNIAPREDDVWSHKQLLKVVSHTPVEVDALNGAQAAGNWVDLVRQAIPDGLLYSWWSYRAKDWSTTDKGRRLDHIWATPDIAPKLTGAKVRRDVRGWEKGSDHAPVFATLDI